MALPMRGVDLPQRVVRAVAIAVCALGTQVALGAAAGRDLRTAAVAVIVLASGVVALFAPHWIWVAAIVANGAFWRFGPASLNLSLADIVLVAAVGSALVWVPWRSPIIRRVAIWYGAYTVAVAACVALAPGRTPMFEIGHRAVMFFGALLVGSAIGARGQISLAIKAVLLGATVLAVAAIVVSIGSGFEPAYPFGIHKNAVGALLAYALAMSLVGRPLIPLSRGWMTLLQTAWLGGLLATQARGAGLAIVGAAAIALVRGERSVRNPVVVLGLAAVVGLALATFVDQQTNPVSDNRFNSANSRTLTYQAAIEVWDDEPWFGSGIKFWNDPDFAGRTEFGEPHNVFVSGLAETGLVGTAALCWLVGGVVVMLWRMRSPIARAAVLMVVARLVDVQFGIFWVAVTGSIVWIFVGMAIGEASHLAEARDQEPKLLVST
jgi:hypothetical protein